jgi:hypothetical protein
MKDGKHHLLVTLALASVLFPVLPSNAALVLSTYGNTNAPGAAFVTSRYSQANSFTTSASPGGWQLNSVTINIDSVVNTSGNFSLSIYDTSSGKPGNELTFLSGSSNPSVGDNTYTASSFSADSSTTYWLVAKVSSGSGWYNWTYDSDESLSFTTSGDWSVSASSTSASADSGVWGGAFSGYPFIFSIDATAGSGPGPAPIPEPGTWAAAILLAGGAAFARWRKRGKVS